MTPVSGVDTDIYYTWAQQFGQETEFLRRAGQKILIEMDGYACHVSLKVLNLFKENDFIVAGLPAYTYHILQPLDVRVFGSLNERSRSLLSKRTIVLAEEKRNDIFSLCDLLTQLHHVCVIACKKCNQWLQKSRCLCCCCSESRSSTIKFRRFFQDMFPAKPWTSFTKQDPWRRWQRVLIKIYEFQFILPQPQSTSNLKVIKWSITSPRIIGFQICFNQ